MSQARSSTPARFALGAAIAAIVVGAWLAYGNSFNGAYFLDDQPSILANQSIRHLWPLSEALNPQFHTGLTVSGRPLVSLTLALNYAIGGLDVRGYHVVNLVIHILAGLALFGIVRRTVKKGEGEAIGVGLAVALIWVLHPLQTESVTYIIQRAESLMGLFYLLTLYCFVREVAPASSYVPPGGTSEDKKAGAGVWGILSIVCCFFGMAAKEEMVSAPLMVLLYDRTFIAGSFREAWRQRSRFYLALASTWLLLAWLAISNGNRGGTSGVDVGINAGRYWLTQFPAIANYLKLSFWPAPLIFDYGTQWVQSVWTVLPSIILILAVLAGMVVALKRWPKAGFLGVWFFVLLAPTSIVPGNRQTAAEHRMYLPLAAVICAAFLVAERVSVSSGWSRGRATKSLRFVLLLSLIAALGLITHARNRDYDSELTLYGDNVAKLPGNAFTQNGFAVALVAAGRSEEAVRHYQEALRLNPRYSDGYNNLGLVYFGQGQLPEAVAHYREALRLNPDNAEAHSNLGIALLRMGNADEALTEYRQALKINPNYPEAANNLGNLYKRESRPDEAIAAFEQALRLRPNFPEAANNLGVALAQRGRLPEAIARFEQAVRLNPTFPDARNNLGLALKQAGRLPEAIAQLQEAIRLKPDYAMAHANLGLALQQVGRTREGKGELELAARLRAGH